MLETFRISPQTLGNQHMDQNQRQKSHQNVSVRGWHHCLPPSPYTRAPGAAVTGTVDAGPRIFPPSLLALPLLEVDIALSPVISKSNFSLYSFESISSDSKLQETLLVATLRSCTYASAPRTQRRQTCGFLPRHIS